MAKICRKRNTNNFRIFMTIGPIIMLYSKLIDQHGGRMFVNNITLKEYLRWRNI